MTGHRLHHWMALVAVLALAVSCHAQTIKPPEVENLLANPGFETGDREGWTTVLAGDRAGEVSVVEEARGGEFAARIEAPTDRAWSVLRQQDFDVSVGETLVATAWVRSSSARAKMVLTGGFLWGGSPSGHQYVRSHHSGSGQWERLRVELTIEQLPVSLAIGFDYRSAGSVVLVDDVRLARETDVVAEEAAVWANELAGVADREDLPDWVREGMRERIRRGAELIGQYHQTARDDAGFEDLIAALREYSATRNQLVTWVAGEHAPDGGEAAPLAIASIDLNVLRGRQATVTLGLLNAFGQHSVAVRIVPGALHEAGSEDSEEPPPVALAGGQIDVAELIAHGGDVVAADPGEDLAVWAPADEPRQVRLTLRAEGLAPGTYTGTLTVLPLDPVEGGRPQDVPVTLTVEE